jgi:hypothetical protein
MATAQALSTAEYKLFPNPRNQHRVVFAHQVFVPYPYMLIEMESYYLKGRFSLFAAHRIVDNKAGQLVTFEDAADEAKFKSMFVPD